MKQQSTTGIGKKILVAVIAFNEEKNIPIVLNDLKQHNFGFDVVVIDNGSPDNTALVSQQLGAPTIVHSVNSGSSAGTLMSYFLYAYRYDYDIVCQFDGDGQHLAEELPKIVNPVLENQADYVIGSRFLEREGFQSTPIRRMGIRLFSSIDSMILGMPITDVTSGFRAYGKRIIEFFGHLYKHEVYDTSQLLLLSHFAGARVLEVPVKMRERIYGTSEFTPLTSAAYIIKGLVNVVGCLMQRKQIRQMMEAKYGN